MPSQLRIYTINKGKMDEFVKAWTAGVYPLRHKLGFTIPAAWVIRERNEFVWILAYDGRPEDWQAKEAAYYGSTERAALNPDPAQFIARAEHWFVTPLALPPR